MKTATPEKKSVRTLKGQLFGAISMMLVAAIALGTSTYAWFINNRTVEVEEMQLNVSTSASMLVAVGKMDGTTYTGFKTVVTNDDITGLNTAKDAADWSDMFVNKLSPATVSAKNLTFTAPKFYATNNHVSNSRLDEFLLLTHETGDGAGDIGQGSVKKIPLKFKSSNNTAVYFGKEEFANGLADMVYALTGTDPTDGRPTWALQAEDIKKVLHIAIVPDSTGEYATSTDKAVIFQFDDGTAHITDAANNTDYQYVTTIDGNPGTSVAALQDETAGKFASINATDADNHITEAGKQETKLPLTAATSPYWATVSSGEVTAPTVTGSQLFELKAGEERMVDLYIWLEGTDQDCLNALSAYGFNLNLPFAGVISTTTAP